MKNYEEELYLRLSIVNNQAIRIETQRDLREKTYKNSRALPFEVEIKITSDYLKAVNENMEAEREVNQRLNA